MTRQQSFRLRGIFLDCRRCIGSILIILLLFRYLLLIANEN